MKKNKYILTLILVLTIGTTYAHQDFVKIKDFDNVKVRIKTGFEYEEINKVFIYAQLSQQLASSLGYKEQIFLDFHHHYTNNCEPDYFISFDKGTIIGDSKLTPLLAQKAIVIRQVAKQFDAETTLKLVEYAILNVSRIKFQQKRINYHQNYNHWEIRTIDTLKIHKSLTKQSSEAVLNLLSKRIYRPENDFKYGISYFWENCKFTVFKRDPNTIIEIITLDNIYEFKRFGIYSAIVFDSDSSFYYSAVNSKNIISNRQVIERTENNYKPFKVEYIGGNKLSIYFEYLLKEPEYKLVTKTLIYLIDKEEMIQDLDKLINQK
jgi:hypothetical protein